MSARNARIWLNILMLVCIGFDASAAFAWWVGKPWHVVVGMLALGTLSHPSAHPTLRKWASG